MIRSEVFEKISFQYRGIRAEDLCQMNPEYSCVICGSSLCHHWGTPNRSCPNYVPISEEEFAKNYNFKELK